jgi:hypothetical protein
MAEKYKLAKNRNNEIIIITIIIIHISLSLLEH